MHARPLTAVIMEEVSKPFLNIDYNLDLKIPFWNKKNVMLKNLSGKCNNEKNTAKLENLGSRSDSVVLLKPVLPPGLSYVKWEG